MLGKSERVREIETFMLSWYVNERKYLSSNEN